MKRSIICSILCALSVPALGGGTSRWTHTTEADFKKGKFQNVVATNLGDLKLSRAVKTLLEQEPGVSAVYALAEGPDGTVYAGTGPNGVVLAVKGEKVSTLLKLDDENVFSLLVDRRGRLLIGTGGEKGRILRLDKPDSKPVEVFAADGVQYVWQMRQTPDGNVYAATGPNGQIFEVKPDDSHAVLFDADDSNVLSLATDDGDLLYAGTDPSGLVYRINRKDRSVFVLYDAPETEVSALVLDAKGNLYAATGQASETDVTAPEAAAAEKAGRPEGGENVTPLPSPAPKDPEKPKLPDPRPTEPDPIPKKPDLLVIDDRVQGEVLEKAAEAPEAPTPTPGPPAPPTPPNAPPTRGAVANPFPQPNAAPNAPAGDAAATQGNAIYRIDPEGFVTEVFRQPVMVLSLVEKDGVLLAGTGSDGLIYQINPAAEETVVLAKVDPKQVMSMLPLKDGRLILGLANVGGLASLSGGFATEGSYTSPVLDAGQISRFGKIHLTGSLPSGSKLTVATRSGNLQEPGETTWSRWSEEKPAAEYLQVAAPAARFLQYRLSFTSADGGATAVVDEVDVAYAAPNLPPQIKSIKINGAADDAAQQPAQLANAPAAGAPVKRVANPVRTITWEATDPNADAVEYTLFFRSGSRGPWIQLQDKLAATTHSWDTKLVPDGRYYLRVVASDVKANPKGAGRTSARVSDPVVVDNTPPAIANLKVERLPKGAKVEMTVADRTSTVAAVDYAVNSKDDWQAVASSDSIFDSPDEGVNLTLDDLPAGTHQVMLRATDEFGNQSFETVQVTVDAK